MAELKVKPINGDCVNPRLNVVFVHGLDGDAVGTWCYEGGEDDGYFWPRGLAKDMAGLAVYSLGYPADKASWGSGWPIAEAAVAVLERLMSNRALRASGDTPIVFVCHSLGGLIIKKLVLVADRDRGQDAQKGKFLDRIRGVVFLATPHGGSMMATIPSQMQWFVSDAMRDLKANDAALLDLSNSYRNCIADNQGRIRHCVFYEKRPMFGVAKAVAPMSADPGIVGVRPVAIDRDHGAICKPLDRDDPVYEGTLRFLEDALATVPPTRDDKLDNILQILSQKESVPLEALRGILAEMGEAAESYSAAEIEQKLTVKASEFVSLNDRLNRLSNADPETSRLRHAAAAALRKGSFAEADACLAAAEARDLSGAEDIEALAKEKRISAAQTRGERAAAAMLRTNPDAYAEAAMHYAEAARIVAKAEGSVARNYLWRQGAALVALGNEFGRNSSLLEAIEHFRKMSVSCSRKDDPPAWATTQNSLGNTLSMLGERESGTARLEEAVLAFRAALEEMTRERVPLDWATTQNNLGNTLLRLGERESGTARLEEAVLAFRAALEERTRERVPLAWATTQNNLGNTLSRLGERESGTARLEEAVLAYRAAIEEGARERVPLQWAMSFGNQGVALMRLADRTRDGATAETAVRQLEAAFETMRAAGHAPFAAYYESRLPEARRIRDALKVP